MVETKGGRSIYSHKYHKSNPRIKDLIKSFTYLETRELYVKIQQSLKQYLLPDIVEYCFSVYCNSLGEELSTNIVIS